MKSLSNKKNSKKNFNSSPYFEQLVEINRITKVTKGGRQFRFSALVIVGDKNGSISVGKGKSNEVVVAIRKANEYAKSRIQKVRFSSFDTIPFEIVGKWGASRVLLKPCKSSKGIIAGGVVQTVLKLVGIKNIYGKILGSRNKTNCIKATINALMKLKDVTTILNQRNFEKLTIIKDKKIPVVQISKEGLSKKTDFNNLKLSKLKKYFLSYLLKKDREKLAKKTTKED